MGKALYALSNRVPSAAAVKYDDLKEALLEAMGLSVEHCRRELWTYQKRFSDSPQDVARHMEAMVNSHARVPDGGRC